MDGSAARQMTATALGVVVLSLWSHGPSAADSPMFLGGPTHVVTAEGLQAEEGMYGRPLFVCRGGIFGTPALVEGILYFGSADGHLYAVEVATGEELWEFATAFDIKSSPAVDAEQVYFGCTDGRLYCLDRETGDLLWEVPTGEAITSSPCVSEGVVYIGSRDGNLYAVDALAGTVLWQVQVPVRGVPINSSPAVWEGRVYFGAADGRIHCVSAADGTPGWDLTTEGKVDASPVIADGVLYVGSWGGTMYAVDATSGDLLWAYPTARQPTHSSVAVGEQSIFFGGVDGRLYAVNKQQGTTAWRFQARGPIYGTPVLAGERLYFGDSSGMFWCLRAGDGQEIDRLTPGAGQEVYRRAYRRGEWYVPIHSTPVVTAEAIYLGSETGAIFAVQDVVSAVLSDPNRQVTKALFGVHLVRTLELPPPAPWAEWPQAVLPTGEPNPDYARYLAAIGAISSAPLPGGEATVLTVREPGWGDWERPLSRYDLASILYKLFFEPNALGVQTPDYVPELIADADQFPAWCENVPPIIVAVGLMATQQGRFNGREWVTQQELWGVMEAVKQFYEAYGP